MNNILGNKRKLLFKHKDVYCYDDKSILLYCLMLQQTRIIKTYVKRS